MIYETLLRPLISWLSDSGAVPCQHSLVLWEGWLSSILNPRTDLQSIGRLLRASKIIHAELEDVFYGYTTFQMRAGGCGHIHTLMVGERLDKLDIHRIPMHKIRNMQLNMDLTPGRWLKPCWMSDTGAYRLQMLPTLKLLKFSIYRRDPSSWYRGMEVNSIKILLNWIRKAVPERVEIHWVIANAINGLERCDGIDANFLQELVNSKDISFEVWQG